MITARDLLSSLNKAGKTGGHIIKGFGGKRDAMYC
jgi:hypothetical protein